MVFIEPLSHVAWCLSRITNFVDSFFTCKLLKPLIGVVNVLDNDDIVGNWENGFAFNCNGESSGLLVGVTANVPTQLPFIDEFDSDEFDSDNEFRRPYISETFIDSPNELITNVIK